MTSGRDQQVNHMDAKDSANSSSILNQQVKKEKLWKEKLSLDLPKLRSDHVATEYGIEDGVQNRISIQDTNVPGCISSRVTDN